VRREQSEMLQALLSRLPPDDRAAIVMRYWYDLSYEEIAEATGATVSAVKSRLHRARGSLGEMLPGGAGAARAPRAAGRPALRAPGG
jgi:RNA polymerase sigma-70 factor (ECF subfamily)